METVSTDDRQAKLVELGERLKAVVEELEDLGVAVFGAEKDLRDPEGTSHCFGNELAVGPLQRRLAVTMALGPQVAAANVTAERVKGESVNDTVHRICEEWFAPMFGMLHERGISTVVLLELPDQRIDAFNLHLHDKKRSRILMRALQYFQRKN